MYRFLKIARVFVSLFFLISITLSFIYFINRDTLFFSNFLKVQFVPAFLGVFSGTALFFLIILLITLLFGRLYCSTLCPLGIYQDIVSAISRKFKSKKNRRFKFDLPKNKLRYSILLFIAILFVFGISYPLAILDPYSNWGKISNEIISRSEQLIHNIASGFFPETIYYRPYAQFSVLSFIFAILFFAIVTIFSAFRGRLYCNTICPVGAFLGLFSKTSLFKPTINKSMCTSCHLCLSNCKSQCIDLKTKTIDESRCVACFNCMISCTNSGISYKFRWTKEDAQNNQQMVSDSRRTALIAFGALGTALAVKAANLKPILSSKHKNSAIAPPGAQTIELFKKNCTACHACISACPNNIIKPSVGEYGIEGLLLPVLSFDHHFCSYECNICSTVCPNNALKKISLEEKKLTQIGEVQFELKKCIVYTDRTDCGACDEHCPTKAIKMIPYEDGLVIPSIETSLCIGCGGCEYICPAEPKAIVVHGLPIQTIAKKPEIIEQKKIEVDDFGF